MLLLEASAKRYNDRGTRMYGLPKYLHWTEMTKSRVEIKINLMKTLWYTEEERALPVLSRDKPSS